MSLTIGGAASAGSILQQLQNMQKQLNTMSDMSKQNAPAMGNASFAQEMQIAQDIEQGQSLADMARDHSAVDSVGKFEGLLKSAFENVNVLQNTAGTMQSRFDVGDRSMTLADVMLATQKASISFEATMQVRNKMVEAYRTVMQMQI